MKLFACNYLNRCGYCPGCKAAKTEAKIEIFAASTSPEDYVQRLLQAGFSDDALDVAIVLAIDAIRN